MRTGHIDSYDAAMSKGIIPGSHRMVSFYRRIVEFCYIPGGIDSRHIGLQVLIRHNPTTYLDGRVCQKSRIECNSKTNSTHIALNFTPFLRFTLPAASLFG